MRLLLHTCCAPCLIGPLEDLKSGGFEVAAFFYNPNIHPLLEFRKRIKAIRTLESALDFSLFLDEEYGLREFLDSVNWKDNIAGRCKGCYRMRLNETARMAVKLGINVFSTTLLSSRHQNHEDVRRAGESASAAYGPRFFYKDMRSLSVKSHEEARRRSIYRQKYCGCIFSEMERYSGPVNEDAVVPGWNPDKMDA